MVIRKQLSHTSKKYKFMGILAGTALLRRLGEHYSSDMNPTLQNLPGIVNIDEAVVSILKKKIFFFKESIESRKQWINRYVLMQ